MHDPSRINVVGPLQPFAAGFAEWLVRHGYTPISATFQLYVMAHLSRWLTVEGLKPARALDRGPGAVSRRAAPRRVHPVSEFEGAAADACESP
jgi:hypothetical protein